MKNFLTTLFLMAIVAFAIGQTTAEQKINYSDMTVFSEGLARVKRDKLYGFIDKNGTEVISCQYSEASSFSDGLCKVKYNDSIFYIDRTGKKAFTVTPYFSYSSFSNDRLLVQNEDNNHYGFMNKKGDMVIPCIYDFARDFSEGITFVTTDEWLRAVVDTSGKVIGKKEAYFNHFGFSDGVALVSIIGENYKEIWFFVDRYQNVVLDCKDEYNYSGVFQEGLSRVEQNKKYGYIDKKGNVIIPCIYEDANDFTNGIALVKSNNKYGFINKKGKIEIPFIYEDVDYYVSISSNNANKGVAKVKKDGLWGLICDGKKEINCQFEDVEPFIDSELAPVQKNGFWGYINKNGEIIIPCQYKSATSFFEGLALVSDETNFMYIDDTNTTILTFMKSKNNK